MQARLTSRKFLIVLLIILLIALVTLVYTYFAVSGSRPKTKTEASGYTHLFSIYGYGKRPSQLMSRPNGVAVSSSGHIYVTDQGNNRVLVFDKEGDFLFKFGKKGDGKGEFKAPMGVALGPQDQVFVTDRIQNKVLIFNASGKFIREFQVRSPLTPTVKNSRLYVTTYDGVSIYDFDGKQLKKFGQRGSQKQEFDFPNGIAVDSEGNMFVADSNNLRIQALDRDGNLLWLVGQPPSKPQSGNRDFGLPVSVAIDENQVIYIVDAFPGSIRVMGNKGKQLGEVGEFGTEDGELNHPAQIAYAGNRVFYIADRFNDRVQAIKMAESFE